MSPIEIERHDGFQIIAMNWTPDYPGFRASTFDDVSDLIQAADFDPDLAATVFCGVQRCFCLGSDVSTFLDRKDFNGLSGSALGFFRSLMNAKKPLIAAVDGEAVGLGMTMLCHFDAIYATPESSFKAPFTDWGLVPEAASSMLLPELLGHRKAFELFCLGGQLSAQEAERYGLVTRIVDRHDLLHTAKDAARRLARAPAQSLRKTRALLRDNNSRTARRAKLEADIFQELLGDRGTQRRLQIMARAIRKALAA